MISFKKCLLKNKSVENLKLRGKEMKESRLKENIKINLMSFKSKWKDFLKNNKKRYNKKVIKNFRRL